jgi:methylglutaconyl-CoA hydratase
MDGKTLDVRIDSAGVARVFLARPDARNALNGALIAELRAAAKALAADPRVRVVVLGGEGETFCTGGDLEWMRSMAGRTRAERIAESAEVGKMLEDLDALPMPLVGRVHGSVLGGGVGLVSVCDVAIGVNTATFGLTEVRLGLIPANIAPFVIARIGAVHARRIFFNGQRFDAHKAQRLNLLSEVVEPEGLDTAIEYEVRSILQCAPGAVAQTKSLVRHIARHPGQDVAAVAAEKLADAWETDEAREGIASFFAKGRPPWSPG